MVFTTRPKYLYIYNIYQNITQLITKLLPKYYQNISIFICVSNKKATAQAELVKNGKREGKKKKQN